MNKNQQKNGRRLKIPRIRHVLLGGVVEDGLDAKGAQVVEHRLDGHLVLAGDELSVEGRLHELVEEAAAEQAAAQLGELQKKKLVFFTIYLISFPYHGIIVHQVVKLANLEHKDGPQQLVGGLALVRLLRVAKRQVKRVQAAWRQCFRISGKTSTTTVIDD